jgi:hypothetical protein
MKQQYKIRIIFCGLRVFVTIHFDKARSTHCIKTDISNVDSNAKPTKYQASAKKQCLLLFAEPFLEAHGRTRIHAEEGVSQEKSQVSPYIGKEAVEVIDDVLLPLAVACS